MVAQVRKPTEIQSAAIYRCTDKATGNVFYMVKSDSSSEYYQVTWNEAMHGWDCQCPATKPCKHIRAVCEVIRAKKEQAVIAEAVAVVEQADDLFARKARGDWHSCERCGNKTLQTVCGRCQLEAGYVEEVAS